MDKAKAAETTQLGAEFLGSFLVVFVVCSNYSAGKADGALAVFGPTSIACVYMAMTYALKSVSGGILNPAITAALTLHQKISMVKGFKLVAAQCAGGAAAGFATLFLYGWKPQANIIEPHSGSFLVGAPLVEALYTCLLCFVYMNVTRSSQNKPYFGLAVGFVFIAGGVGGKYVSGGAYNPAVSLGVNFMGTNWKVITLPIYVAAQMAGAVLAVVLFDIVRKGDKEAAPQATENAAERSSSAAMDAAGQKADEVAEATRGWLTKAVQAVTAKFDPEDTCEFIGTLFLSLTISLNQIAQLDAETNAVDNASIYASAGKVWSSAACLISIMYALSDCSGGLFNPAITAAYAIRFWGTGEGLDASGKVTKLQQADRICDWKLSSTETLKYFVFQLLGGAAGTGLTILVWLASGTWPVAAIQPGKPPNHSTPYTDFQAMFAEFYGTFLISFAMVVVMLSKDAVPDFGPFVVGGCVIAAGYAFGPLSGGFFNPAIVIGDAVGSKLQVVYTLPPGLYLLGEMLGGVLAGAVFRLFTHKDEIQVQGNMQESLLP
jgi:aquaporin Z